MGPTRSLRTAGLAASFLCFAACTSEGLPTRPLPDGHGGGAGDGGASAPWGTQDTGEDTDAADGGASDGGSTDGGTGEGGTGEGGTGDGGTGDGGTGDGGTEPDDSLRVVVKPDYLNLHAGPSNSDPVLRALGCGSEVTVTGDADGNWLPVAGAGEDGWVKKAWLARPDAAGDDPCPGPAPYLDDTPGRVEDLLSVTPYVEQDCRETSFEGWPFEAERCTYNGGLVVKVANPSAEQVTAWIADASQLIPALWALEERDRDAWKDGLEIIASHTLYQSSRIFPLEGEVDEGYVYDFSRGVTEGCSTGCYCRINSLTRQQWCEYADKVLDLEDEDDCLDEYSTTAWTEAWADHCLDAHRAAWTGVHHGYRAMAWWANQTMEDAFPDPEEADPDDVIDLLDALY